MIRKWPIVRFLISMMIAGMGLATSAWAQSDTVRCLGMRFEFTSVPTIDIQLSDLASEDSIVFLKNTVVLSPAFKAWNAELQGEMKRLHVPDWCMIPIIDATFPRCSPLTRLVIQYSSLALSGFWPELCHRRGQTALRVWSKQRIINIAYYKLNQDRFYLIAGPDRDYPGCMTLKRNNRRGKRSFGLFSDSAPSFEHNVVVQDSVEMFFEPSVGESRTYTIHLDVHQTWLTFLENSPMPTEPEMRGVAVSDVGKQKLLMELQTHIPKDNDKEALDFLLAFTAWCADYQIDQAAYGKEKPLFPEQTSAYPASDCEDRVYLFDFLVGELLPALDVIYVAYPDHLVAAVDLKKDVGDVITVKGKTYSICDPTGKSGGSFRMGDKMVDYEGGTPEAIVPVRWRKGR